MKIFFTTLILLTTSFQILFAQIEFKLERLQDDSGWGVYAKYDVNKVGLGSGLLPEGHTPTDDVDLGSAQVTIITPLDFVFKELHNFNGIWSQNAKVISPEENPGVIYYDVGYLSSFPKNGLAGEEILLFTFKNESGCSGEIQLMENDDPFHAPNSAGNNPGNNFSVIDKGDLPSLYLYNWIGNYQDCPDVCEWCEQSFSSTNDKSTTYFEVYPNPSNGSFNIDLGDSFEGAAQIQIINNLGQVVFQEKTSFQRTELNTNLQNGIYSMLIQNSNNTISTQRIIIQK